MTTRGTTTVTTHVAHLPGLLHRVWGPAAVGVTGAGLVAALALRDPHVPGSWGSCVLLDATGLWCPGCGGLRAVNDLTHLDLVGAVSSNAVAVLLVVLLGTWWAVWAWSATTGRGVRWERWFTPARAYGLLALVLAFSVLRNLPGFEAFGP